MSNPRDCLQRLNECIQNEEFYRISQIVKEYPRPADLNYAYDQTGQSILYKLVYIENEDEALALIEFFRKIGCDIKHRDNNKQWALHYAARLEKAKIVQYFLRAGFDLNEDDYFLQTPLFYSSKYNKRAQVAQLLIDAGCDINRKDANGQSCIFYAAAEGNLEIVRTLVERGANPLLTDKKKERPLHYAKRNGHIRVAEYLSSFKNDMKKVKEVKQDRRIQSSSQNTVDRRKKRQIVKSEYALVYINQDGQIKVLNERDLLKFKEASDQNEKLYRMMDQPDDFGQPIGPPPDKKFEKIIMKILNHFIKDENAAPFCEPVNYQSLGLHDYPTIVKYPMDFGTIKKKIMYNGYNNETEFQGDMNLVFDNCILYNGTGRDIGKIALQMKTQFNAMFIKQFS